MATGIPRFGGPTIFDQFAQTGVGSEGMFEMPGTGFSNPLSSSAGMGGGAAPTAAPGMSPSTAIGIAAVAGAINQAVGSYYQAKSAQDNLKFQAEMNKINARMAETQAQHVMDEARDAIAKVGYQAGKIKGTARAAMAAHGIQLGVGSAKEVIATTDVMKEIDSLTINANAVRAASAARMQGVNYSNQALMQQASASSISPFGSAFSSLLGGASDVGYKYYMMKGRT